MSILPVRTIIRLFLMLLFAMPLAQAQNTTSTVSDSGRYTITGTADKSLNGQEIVLEKEAEFMGTIPVDTTYIENGKFFFSDTVSAPSFYFISIPGSEYDKLRFIAESGHINVEVDRDTLAHSKIFGTYNNDKYYEYANYQLKNRKNQQEKSQAFYDKHKTEIEAARATMDTTAMSRLQKLYIQENKQLKEIPHSL